MLALSALAAVLAAGVASAAGSDSYMIQFRMPSNNIFCAYEHYTGSPIGLRCEIRSGIKPTPPRPKTCGDAVWAAGYWLGRFGSAQVLCISDTIASYSAKVLTYGTTWRRDTFTCTSRSTGLRCTNGSGRGFFLSRERTYTF